MANIERSVDSNLELFPILPSFPTVDDAAALNGRIAAPLTGIARLAAASSPAGEGHGLEARSLSVRSILNRSVSRRGLSFAWSINPYRGCEFACRYCYARYTHEFMELRQPDDFERKIFIKQNAAWLLEQELKQVRPGEEIALGTATDPYQPVERRARVTESLDHYHSERRSGAVAGTAGAAAGPALTDGGQAERGRVENRHLVFAAAARHYRYR
jgi:hypothetical protein